MQLELRDKGLISERYLRQSIYFMEYCRKNPDMSFLLFWIQMNLIVLWSKHAFIKQVPFNKKELLAASRVLKAPFLNDQKLEESLLTLDQLGFIAYHPAIRPDHPDRFTMIRLLKVRAYPQLIWRGNTFRGIKSLKKHMQLNAPLAIDQWGLRMAESKSPFAPPLKQVKDLFSQYNYPAKEAVEFYRHYQYNDWIHLGKTVYNWEKAAHSWMKKSKKRPTPDQLKT